MRKFQLAAALLSLLLLAGCAVPGGDASPSASSATTAYPEDAPFQVRMLDVGQGLSVLIQSDDAYLLYDGGGRSSSSYVVSYLKQKGIDTLDYMVVSHYDEDHISGLVGALNTTEVETVLSPDYEADSKIYASFRSMLAQNGAREIHPAPGDTYTLGTADIQVVGPKTYAYPEENSRSVAIRVRYGAFSCILTGDAEIEAEEDMVSSGLTLDSDLYVVGHHGSTSSSSADFVAAVSPDYAFLSVGAGNSYGHPAEKTLSTLRKQQVQLFRTDIQGEVTAYSDGTACWFSTAPCTDWSPGAQGQEDTDHAADAKKSVTYVLNESSHIFHRPDCTSVPQIKAANRKSTRAAREKLIAQGYRPCQICSP